jgi:hypothetical protein
MYRYNFPCTFDQNSCISEISYDSDNKSWIPPKYMIEEFDLKESYKNFSDTISDTISDRLLHFEDCNIIKNYNLPFIPCIISKKNKNRKIYEKILGQKFDRFFFCKIMHNVTKRL